MPARPAQRAEPGGIVVQVRVTPRAGRDAVAGAYRATDGAVALSVKVRAAPADGAANAAVRACLAAALGRPLAAVTLRAGASGRLKTVAIAGDADALSRAVAALLAPAG